MMKQHLETECDASIGVFDEGIRSILGSSNSTPRSDYAHIREKPTNTYFVSMGIYILRREAVGHT